MGEGDRVAKKRIGRDVFLETVGKEDRMVICGAGYVGSALAKLSVFAGIHTILLEDRKDFADRAKETGAQEIICRPFDKAIRDLTEEANTAYVVMTRGHAYDEKCMLEIAKKESEKLFIGTEVVHNPVKEFVPLKEVKVGQEVCIAELNQLATVLALPDKNGDVLVRAGIIKTKVPLKGLKQPDKLIKEPQPKTRAQQRYSRLTGDANRPNGRVERVQRSAKMELNLLGLTVDEALPEWMPISTGPF